jgi:hypothetical protein
MLETCIALVLAHLLADFVLQSDMMVRQKTRSLVLLQHCAIVATLSWVALGFALAPILLLFVAVSHFGIDWVKAHYGGPGFASFAADQAAHLLVIAAGSLAYPDAYASGLWQVGALRLPAALDGLLPVGMAVAAGLVAAIWAGGFAVRALMQAMELPADPACDESLPKGGQLIGRLERLMIFMLVLADQPGAIGFLIAAKSVLRFSDLAQGHDRRVSEYVIIGTLASFAWALAISFATSRTLTTLGAS